MASPKRRRPPPRDAANGLPECRLLASFDGSENSPHALLDQVKIVAAHFAAIDPALIVIVVALAMGVAR
jgi:hypothetical protein